MAFETTTNRILVVAFLLVISLPPAANLVGFDGGDPGAENRELAPFPRFHGALTSAPTYLASLSVWFDDHFGFRSALVRWYGESRLSVLGVSSTTVVIKGRNGWFFYGEDGSVEDFSRERPADRRGAAGMA